MPHAYFFLAEHAHPVGPGLVSGEMLCDTKAIGLFASRADAQAAIARVTDTPGFRDFVDGFSIRRVRVTLAQGMTKQDVRTVSYAYHEYYDNAEDCDVYTTGVLHADPADAERELADMRREPRLAAHPDGFDIGGYIVGQVMWAEGFTLFEELTRRPARISVHRTVDNQTGCRVSCEQEDVVVFRCLPFGCASQTTRSWLQVVLFYLRLLWPSL